MTKGGRRRSGGRAGEACQADGGGEVLRATSGDERSGTGCLMEEVVEKTNLKAALKRVRQNKGGPGIDAMTVGELPDHLKCRVARNGPCWR